MSRREVLSALTESLAAEAHVLVSDPALVRQQVCNRLERRAPGVGGLRVVLDGEAASRREPWLRLLNVPRESDELARTILAGQDGVCEAAPGFAEHVLSTRGRDGTAATWDLRACTRLTRSDTRADASNEWCEEDTAGAWMLHIAEPETGRRLEVVGEERLLVVRPDDGGTRDEEAVYLAGHTEEVTCGCVLVAEDGHPLVASGAKDATVRLWDPSTGDELALLGGHSAPVTYVGQAPSGCAGRIVSASLDDTIRLWRFPRGKGSRRGLGHQGAVSAVALSDDGRRAVTAGEDGAAMVWDLESGTALWSSAGYRVPVRSAALDVSGTTVALGLADGAGVLWDVEEDAETLSGTWSGPVFDGRGFVVEERSGHVRLVPKRRLLGGTRWAPEPAAAKGVPRPTNAEADEGLLRAYGCRFPCAARITTLASDDGRGRAVCGDEMGNVYLLLRVDPRDPQPRSDGDGSSS